MVHLPSRHRRSGEAFSRLAGARWLLAYTKRLTIPFLIGFPEANIFFSAEESIEVFDRIFLYKSGVCVTQYTF